MKQEGLSLMELMIALAIVAIIAGMAFPKYQKMVARSKQTEAKTILQAIYMGQDVYKTSNQTYADTIDDLDIQIPTDVKYAYSITTDNNGTTFEARALANIDTDSIIDEWVIDHNNNLENRTNDVIE